MFTLSNLPIEERGMFFPIILFVFFLFFSCYILYFMVVVHIVNRISFSTSSVGTYAGNKVLIFVYFLLFGHLVKLPY